MSGSARASQRPAPPPPPPPQQQHPASAGPIVPPIKRHLAFVSTKPPFAPSDDYHRFSSAVTTRRAVDQEPEAVVVRSSVSSFFPFLFLFVYFRVLRYCTEC